MQFWMLSIISCFSNRNSTNPCELIFEYETSHVGDNNDYLSLSKTITSRTTILEQEFKERYGRSASPANGLVDTNLSSCPGEKPRVLMDTLKEIIFLLVSFGKTLFIHLLLKQRLKKC